MRICNDFSQVYGGFWACESKEFELRKRGIQKYGVMRMPPKFRIVM